MKKQMEEYQDELLDLPKEIDKVNYELMLDTMEICYEQIAQNTERINEITNWISAMRIELKKNVVRKQEAELKNQQIYSYMHDIFGAEVIDIFDMKYNPETEHVVKTAPAKLGDAPAKNAGEQKAADAAEAKAGAADKGSEEGSGE